MDASAAPSNSHTEGPYAAGTRVLIRGRRWTITDVTRTPECAALRLQGIEHDRVGTLIAPFDRPIRIDADPRPRAVRPRRWLHQLDRALLELHPFGSLRAAAQAPIRLLAYQLEPALAVFRDGTSRVLVADGVGLGKTIQAGILLLELRHRLESARALVLAPAGLREQWLAELATRFGLAPVLADTAWLKAVSADQPAHVNPWSLPGTYIASHDLVKRPEVLRPLEDVTWDAVVVDEAHAAASGTDRRAAIHAIGARARHVMLLTATPHGGDPAVFDALCRIGAHASGDDPIVLFQRSRADVGEGRPRKTTVLTVVPSAAECQMHDLLIRYTTRVWLEAGRRGDERAKLVSIVLRKRALSSAGSLAASVERRLNLLNGAHPDAWQLSLPLAAPDEDPLEDDAPLSELSVPGLGNPALERRLLAGLADAARLAARDERKARFLLRLLARLREPAIVFTEYRDTLARLEHLVADAGHAVTVLHGGMTPSDRGRVQRTFNECGGILLATDAASEGLNLHHRCRVIVHYELAWNPSRLEQRAGRIDRLGQTRRVHELALVAAHTAERLVLAPLIARFRSRDALGGGGGILGALTESRVAAAIMTNTTIDRAAVGEQVRQPASAAGAPADLASQAIREAVRLEHNRQLAARSRRGARRDDGNRAMASMVESGAHVRRGLYLVFALTLVGADGCPVHAEPRLVRVDFDSRLFRASRRPTARHVQDIVSALAIPPDAVVPSLVHQGGHDRLDVIALVEGRRRERRRKREAAIVDVVAGGHPSAARLLVQAGLFDRRSLRAAAFGAASAAARQDDMSERVARLADVPLEQKTRLVAALLVASGR
jgi:superfamily II DNA or RNA helicase